MSDKQKDLGQVWTPDWAINLILDNVGFKEKAVLNKKILEPSFGAGYFFKPIISRMVTAARKQNYSHSNIEQMIDNNLYGIELDIIYNETVAHIKKWAFETYNLKLFLPNLLNQDALDYVSGYGLFDFVVGNPPYVRIHNLPSKMRDKVKNYSHSTGTTDLYLIFYELGLNWLNSHGKLGYIAPNSWARNASQKSFRKDLVTHKYLQKIIDFGSFNVFPQIATYTSIVILNKQGSDQVLYTSMKNANTEHFSISVDSVSLQKESGNPLVFVSEDNIEFLDLHRTASDEQKLSHICRVQNGLATLGDKYFLLPDDFNVDNEDYVRPAVKASTFKGGDIEKQMFFPYFWEDGKYVGLSEQSLKETSPSLHTYFGSFRTLLSSRSLDKNSLWFWYGRSQAIQETNKRKLVITPVIGPNVTNIKTFIVPKGTLVYSGLFITETLPQFPLEKIQKLLESDDALRYFSLLGKDMSGGYKNISAPLIKNFKYK